MKDEKLYILEKVWKIESTDFKFDKDKFDYALIRPCNVDYKTHRNFALGKSIKVSTIVYEGCVSSWYADKSYGNLGFAGPFEQFMVDANVNKLAVPLFENWVFAHNWQNYTVKTIDLKTGEVLYDSMHIWLSERRQMTLI